MEHYLAEQAGNYLVSAQPYSLTIASGATTGTATLDAVDPARTFLVPAGASCGGTVGRDAHAHVQLTDGTTVTGTRNTAGTNTVNCRGSAVQFSPLLVKSVQQGTITLSSAATSNTATIAAVDPTKAVAVFLGGLNAGAGTSINSQLCRVDLTNATTVTATRNAAGAIAATVGYVVVEFQPWAVTRLQQVATTLTTANASDTATLSPGVDPNRSVVFFGGIETGSTGFNNSYYRVELTTGTTVTLTRTGTSIATRTVGYTVVEFAPGVVRSLRRGTVAIVSTTSADATVEFVDENKTWMHEIGFSTTATAFNETYPTVRLVNPTLFRGNKNTGGTTTSTPAYEGVWFN